MPGKLIAFEGIDRCGKRTQMAKLEEEMRIHGRAVLTLSEPNDELNHLGRHIRDILLKKRPAPSPFEFQRFFVIDRAVDLICHISRMLEQAEFVLIERYAYSTLAYGMLDCSL